MINLASASTVSRSLPVLPLAVSECSPDGDEARAFLRGIQGGIVTEAGRGRCGRLLFWRFADPAAVETNAATLRDAAGWVSTAWSQLTRASPTEPFAGDPQGAGREFFSLGLTGAGLDACGLQAAAPDDPDSENFFPPDGLGVFAAGQRAEAGAVLHDAVDADGRPNSWEAPYQERSGGVWLVGGDSESAVSASVARLRAWCDDRGIVVHHEESGCTWRDAAGVVREPFGFADGIAGPKFFAREPPAGSHNRATLEEVFLTEGIHRGGTFLVFRKLEQRVRAFRARLTEHEATRIIGRNPEGVPLAFPAGAGSGTGSCPVHAGSDDFDFAADPHGSRCPFHAHIRRANPRGGDPRANGEIPTRLPLVRRAWVFGTEAALGDPLGAEGGVGLLFLAYARSLTNFRTMQGDWLFRRDFPVRGADRPDGLLFGEFSDDQGVRRRWVEPRGGEYFYVPSLEWLRSVRPARAALFGADLPAFTLRSS